MTVRFAALFMLLAGCSVAPAAESLAFRTRVLPLLTKAGCNSGSCHGAATGQGGFKLSLLGYDPEQDHLNITHELGGRRTDVAAPGASLLLRKATDDLDHEGGRRIKPNSDAHRLLLEWIGRGAAFGDASLRVTRIEVEPADNLLSQSGESVQLRVIATLSDGASEDVTSLALYSSNDDSVADVGKDGKVTTRGSGSTSIMVRYSGQVVAAGIAVPFESAPVAAPDFVPHNFIDEHIIASLRRLRLPPSPLSDDAEFFRRVHLDLSGRLPEPAEVRAFLDKPPSDEKRRRVIAAMLQRSEFVDLWTMKFGDWLLIRGTNDRGYPTRLYQHWVRESIAANRRMDHFVRDLLLAQGDMYHGGPAPFYTLAADPRDMGEHVSSMFLGTQIACARCHAHPADRWTQDDYHAFAACFARVTVHDRFVDVLEQGEVEHPRTRTAVAPRALGAPSPNADSYDRRGPLADWLISADNPFFSRNIVNRVWQHLLGRGLVEPVDDLRPTNPPAHPALLDALASQFVAHDFDLRWLVKEIAASRTYQLTSRSVPGNQRDGKLFSHARLKPLPAQVFADAIAQVTDVPLEFDMYARGTRAVQLVGSMTPSFTLDVMGRCSRARSCTATGSQSGGGLALALHLINGSVINDRLQKGVIDQWSSRKATPREIIDELYLRALSRPPSELERAEWERMFDTAADRTEAARDLLWTVLNSREFAFNH
jgi:hypothetical protein